MNIDEKIDSYLINERKPTAIDYSVKDTALALTGEIESLIASRFEAPEYYDALRAEGFDTGDIANTINLAIKNINRKRVIKNILP